MDFSLSEEQEILERFRRPTKLELQEGSDGKGEKAVDRNSGQHRKAG